MAPLRKCLRASEHCSRPTNNYTKSILFLGDDTEQPTAPHYLLNVNGYSFVMPFVACAWLLAAGQLSFQLKPPCRCDEKHALADCTNINAMIPCSPGPGATLPLKAPSVVNLRGKNLFLHKRIAEATLQKWAAHSLTLTVLFKSAQPHLGTFSQNVL